MLSVELGEPVPAQGGDQVDATDLLIAHVGPGPDTGLHGRLEPVSEVLAHRLIPGLDCQAVAVTRHRLLELPVDLGSRLPVEALPGPPAVDAVAQGQVRHPEAVAGPLMDAALVVAAPTLSGLGGLGWLVTHGSHLLEEYGQNIVTTVTTVTDGFGKR